MKKKFGISILLVVIMLMPYGINLAEVGSVDSAIVESSSTIEPETSSTDIETSTTEDSSSEESIEESTTEDTDTIESTETIDSSVSDSTLDVESEEKNTQETNEINRFSNKANALMEEKLTKILYGTILENETMVFKDVAQIESQKSDKQKFANKTFTLKSFITANNEKYYSLYDAKDVFLGYVKETSLNISNKKEGTAVKYGKYYTITSQSYIVWGSFFSDEKMKTSKINGKTFYAKEIFYHLNGSKYLALYDNQNKFIGYLNEDGATIAPGAQGNYQNYNKYVTITSQKYIVWGGFFTNEKMLTKQINGKTYLAKGIYRHFNGSSYLSLYDNKGKWVGYLNQDGAKLATGAQGTYQNYNKYVTITSQSYIVWGNFFTTQKMKTKAINSKTYLAKGIYRHFNGSSYLSLYDNKGKWVGYLNQDGAKLATGAQGIYQSYEKDVYVTTKSYIVWQNFFTTQKMKTKAIYGRTLRAKGIYRHFNGSNYLSLYDNKGKWVGYLNEASTKLITNGKKVLDVPLIPQLPDLPTGCEITAVTMMLSYHDAKVNKVTLAKEMPKHYNNPNLGYVGNPFTRNGWTIYPPALKNLVKKYGGSSAVLTGKSMNDLENSIRDGKPAVVWMTMHGFTVHAITVTGMDKNNVYFNDPWTGKKNVSMTKKAFLKSWNTQQRRAISI